MTDEQRAKNREYMRRWRANNPQRARQLNAEAKRRYKMRLYLESLGKGVSVNGEEKPVGSD